MTAPDGKPAGLAESDQIGFSTISRVSKGKLNLKGSLSALASMLEQQLGKPVIDETGIIGSYDIRLTYDDGVAGSLEEAVRKLGLKLEPGRRPVEFLLVTRTQ